jgi:predicted nuclease of predicted toxin-antitoxin system
MLKVAADENFNNHILRGLLDLEPDLDAVRVQDTQLAGADDPVMLEWAAQEGRIVLTHDANTVTDFAYERVRQGLPMPGVFQVDTTAPLGPVIEDLHLLVAASYEGEWENQVRYVPLKE